jgi:hypothetical protein
LWIVPVLPTRIKVEKYRLIAVSQRGSQARFSKDWVLRFFAIIVVGSVYVDKNVLLDRQLQL